MTKIAARKGMPDVQIGRHEFARRFRDRFFDSAFEGHEAAIAAIIETAWDAYDVYRKNPRKDPELAKELELKGWDYPRHLAGRVFSVAVHGDAAGVENLRRILTDWLTDIGMIAAGHKSLLGAYVGYLGTYAENHLDLDRDEAFQEEVRTAARALVQAVKMMRAGQMRRPDAGLHEARPK